MTWTDERVEKLKTLNQEGLSAGQIAMRMDCGLSRNAIIGKLTRLGVKMARSPQPMVQRIPRARRRTISPVRAPRAAPTNPVWRPQIEALPPPQVEDVAIVSLLGLEPHHCRFPVGDPQQANFGFCGKHKVPGTSYCAGHLHRCTVPVVRPHKARPNGSHWEREREKREIVRSLGLVPA